MSSSTATPTAPEQSGEATENTAPQDTGQTSAGEPQGDTAPSDAPSDDVAALQAELDKLRKVNRDLERKVKGEAGTLRQQVEELQAKLEGREAEYAEVQKNRQIEAEALAKANQRILNAEVRAAAKGELADPEDALKFLDLSEFEVGDDGSVDTAAIKAAIEALKKEKPYLAAEGGDAVVFTTTNGARTEKPGQITRDELARMTPDQINAARAEGRLNDLLAGNS